MLTIVAWEVQHGGIRLDFCVRGYTNRENLISIPMSLVEGWLVSAWPLLVQSTSGQDFRITQHYFFLGNT